ncbi:MAG: spore coat protein U domain-containing protein, partial [Proteobacteria bacterium]|nr:spore coat protein U domain-containing protein [Pseudomonadota bacterium]
SGFASAGSATTNIPVSATVSKACTIGAPVAIAFGAYDPIGANLTTALTAVGQFSVTCSKGAGGLTVGMGPGLNAVAAQRFMVAATGSTPMKYDLFQPTGTGTTCPGTIPWTNTAGVGMLTLITAPDKNARVYSVCGSIPAGQDVAAVTDQYQDTVIATLNF